MRLAPSAVIAVICIQSAIAADMPPVGRIIVFGDLHLENAVRELLPAVPVRLNESEGDNLSKRLAASKRWRQSDLAWVCCEPSGMAMLYVGVRATDRHPKFRRPPTGAARLDAGDLRLYERLMKLNHEAVTIPPGAEPDSAGRTTVRTLEEKIIREAGQRSAHWVKVALRSGDRLHRAAAIFLAAYGPKNQALADAVAATARDPYPLVRNNAIRAMGILAKPVPGGMRLRLNPRPLLDLFDSVYWTDWNKASFALAALTEGGDKKLLEEIAERATEPLRQIARWPPMHAKPAIAIFTRIGPASAQ